jgi:hypothetical protein
MGTIDVLAPVKKDNSAKITSNMIQAQYTITDTELAGPARRVRKNTNRPAKHSVKPSAIHSMVIIRRLSTDISPNPRTMDFVGAIWAIPQRVIIMDPVYSRIVLIMTPPLMIQLRLNLIALRSLLVPST